MSCAGARCARASTANPSSRPRSCSCRSALPRDVAVRPPSRGNISKTLRAHIPDFVEPVFRQYTSAHHPAPRTRLPVQWPVRGDADGGRVRATAGATDLGHHTVARGRRARPLGNVHLPAGRRERRRSGRRGTSPPESTRRLPRDVLRGPRRALIGATGPSRTTSRYSCRRRRNVELRRVALPGVARPGGTGARDRGDVVRGDRPGPAGRRCRAPGLLQPLRADGMDCRPRGAAGHAPAPRTPREPTGVGSPHRGRRGPIRRRHAVRD